MLLNISFNSNALKITPDAAPKYKKSAHANVHQTSPSCKLKISFRGCKSTTRKKISIVDTRASHKACSKKKEMQLIHLNVKQWIASKISLIHEHTGKISKWAGQVDNFFFPGRTVFTTRSQRTNRFFRNRVLAMSSVSRFLSDSRISLTSGCILKKLTKSFPLKYSTRVSCKTAHLDTKSLLSLTFSANNWKTSFLAACLWTKRSNIHTTRMRIKQETKLTKTHEIYKSLRINKIWLAKHILPAKSAKISPDKDQCQAYKTKKIGTTYLSTKNALSKTTSGNRCGNRVIRCSASKQFHPQSIRIIHVASILYSETTNSHYNKH